MPKPSPFNRPGVRRRLPLKRETRCFYPDPEDRSQSFTLTLQEMDDFAEGAAVDLRRDYYARFIDGKPGKEPERLLLPDKSFVPASRSILSTIANLQAMERPEVGDVWPEGEGVATLRWWLGVIREWPHIWDEVVTWSSEFPYPWERRVQGNLPRADSEESDGTPSAPASNSDNPTPGP